jgi:hypothetical protein
VPEGKAARPLLEEAQEAAAEEETPKTPVDLVQNAVAAATDDAEAKRERRRQRRKSRPHGRAR